MMYIVAGIILSLFVIVRTITIAVGSSKKNSK
jgi:hypothetical protein